MDCTFIQQTPPTTIELQNIHHDCTWKAFAINVIANQRVSFIMLIRYIVLAQILAEQPLALSFTKPLKNANKEMSLITKIWGKSILH